MQGYSVKLRMSQGALSSSKFVNNHHTPNSGSSPTDCQRTNEQKHQRPTSLPSNDPLVDHQPPVFLQIHLPKQLSTHSQTLCCVNDLSCHAAAVYSNKIKNEKSGIYGVYSGIIFPKPTYCMPCQSIHVTVCCHVKCSSLLYQRGRGGGLIDTLTVSTAFLLSLRLISADMGCHSAILLWRQNLMVSGTGGLSISSATSLVCK